MLNTGKEYSMLHASSDLRYSGRSSPTMDSAGAFAYLILFIAIALATVCYSSSYWLIDDYPPDDQPGRFHTGIFEQCILDECTWFFSQEQFLEVHFPDWFKATQGLMTVGLGLGLLALLVATLSLCCTCHSCNPNHPICALLIVACLSMGVGICIFGVKAKDEWKIDIEWNISNQGRFGWSFWVGIGASALALLTGCMYGCMGRKQY